jgi:hypothetical protein
MSMRWQLLLTSALVLPFAIGALALRLAIAPVGDALAGRLASIASGTRAPSGVANEADSAEQASSPTTGRENDGEDDGEGEREVTAAASLAMPRRVASRGPAPRRTTLDEAGREAGADVPVRPSLADAPKATIVVPAAIVTRAMERRDVGATNARAPDGTPLGARLIGVGKYRTGLRDGDVVVAVGGTRTPTVQAMVGAAMQAATTGATRISGRVVRGDATFAVVLELPK